MKTFWSAVLKGAIWVAHYAAEHPDQVVAVAQDIAAARAKK